MARSRSSIIITTMTTTTRKINAVLFYWLSLLSPEVIGRLTMTALQRSLIKLKRKEKSGATS
jgi:hypothetical protein